MAQLMLVNPRKRRKSSRPRTAAQKAATRALVARNRKRPARRKRNPARSLVTAPARRARRRNPSRRGFVQSAVSMPNMMGTFTGAGGALALDIAWGFLPIPVNFKMGPMRHIAKAAGAIGLGFVADMAASRKTAMDMTNGALTVILHDAMRDAVSTFAPQVPLGFYNAGYDAGSLSAYLPAGSGGDSYLTSPLAPAFASPPSISPEGETMGEYMGEYMGY